MLKLICGNKGSGKTKCIIDLANNCIDKIKGKVLFVSDTNQYIYELNKNIKKINVHSLNLQSETEFVGVVKGIMATGDDIATLFVDGISRFVIVPLRDMENCFKEFENISATFSTDIIFTLSCSQENLPEFLLKYEILK